MRSTALHWEGRLVFGAEWADSTLLADYRIAPKVLQSLGFRFVHPELGPALKNLVHSSQKRQVTPDRMAITAVR